MQVLEALLRTTDEPYMESDRNIKIATYNHVEPEVTVHKVRQLQLF